MIHELQVYFHLHLKSNYLKQVQVSVRVQVQVQVSIQVSVLITGPGLSPHHGSRSLSGSRSLKQL